MSIRNAEFELNKHRTPEFASSTTPYRLRAMLAIAMTVCNPTSGGASLGENTAGALSRKFETSVEYNVRTICCSAFGQLIMSSEWF
jgi:hypothetical protein